ncbi:MAG: hypothetical protein MJ101_03340 [Clostridia bacterium]|nr:hypothetical protein [Clostridia bacterium]
METRKRIVRIVIGVLIILIGLVVLGNAIGLWDVDLFPKGWWALALAVMFLVMLINDGPNLANILGIVIFGLLFAKNYLPVLDGIDWWILVVACAAFAFGGKLIRDAVKKQEPPKDKE